MNKNHLLSASDQVGRTSEGASHRESTSHEGALHFPKCDAPGESLHPYPAYKNSGVPWLGDVPAHWDLHRAKFLFRYKKDPNTNGEETNILSLTLRGVVNNDPNNPEGLVPKDYSTYQKFNMGDLVFKLIDLENRQTSRVGLVHEDGIMSPAYVRLIPNAEIVIRYFYHQFFDLYLRGVFNQLGSGVRSTLGPNDLLNLYLNAPPLDEQRAIATHLDYHDRLTRRYIRAQQRLIKLLTEQKLALIQQAVTRGLDPDVPLKDSGIPWLGKIPAHWGVVRSKRTFIPRTELARVDDIQLSATQAYGVIPQDEYERRVGRRIVKIFQHLEKRRHVEVDDFVISMRSFQGGLERAWSAGCIRSSYVVLRSVVPIDVSYFEYLFKSDGYIKALQSTANFIRDGQDLNYHNFCAVDLPFPPIEEQRQIAEYLYAAFTDLTRVVERTEHEIALIREYRTRLIADVVTGKLDVRGFEVGCISESAPHLDEYDDMDDTENGEASEDFEEIDDQEED